MVSMTIPIEDNTHNQIEKFSWISWSEIAREEIIKKEMLERYIKTGKITDEDWKFCEEIDWHPVDELPLKEEYIKKLNKRRKGPFIKLKSVDDLFKK